MGDETKKKGGHTPGPWRVNEDVTTYRDSPYLHSVQVLAADPDASPESRYLSVLANYHPISERARADAALIAAAPDLLTALEWLTDVTIKLAPYSPEVSEGVVAAREAIAKARGQ